MLLYIAGSRAAVARWTFNFRREKRNGICRVDKELSGEKECRIRLVSSVMEVFNRGCPV